MKIKIILLLCIQFTACTDLVEVQLDMTKYHNMELSVSSYFTADSLFLVHLSQTQAAYSSEVFLPSLREASIKDMISGEIYPLKADYNNSDYIALWTNDLIPIENGKYKLSVQTDEPNRLLSAEDSIPQQIPILSTNVICIENSLNFLGSIKFQPNSNQKKSYYEIAIYTNAHWNEIKETTTDFSPQFLTSPDELITREDYYPSQLQFDREDPSTLLFCLENNDGLQIINFEYNIGATCSYVQGTYTCFSPDHDLKIELRSVSPAYFAYKSTIYKQQYASAGDYLYGMAAPVKVIGNVNGGEGFFGGYSKSEVILFVEGSKSSK